MGEKDKLGDTLRDAERAREEQYFAQRDRELLEKLKAAKAGEAGAGQSPVALGCCPKCGQALQATRLYEVTVNGCPSCHGVWLDKGELERISERENEGFIANWLRRITSA